MVFGCGGLIALIVLLTIVGALIGSGGNEVSTGDSPVERKEEAKDTQEEEPKKDAQKQQESKAQEDPNPHFGDGTHRVGSDIQPGTYRTREGKSGCYYERLAGFSGEMDDLLDNGATDAPAIVTILPTDAGFESQRCGTWTQDLSAITQSKTSFGAGAYFVGTDIEPGTYRSSGSSGCYYERLSDFTGNMDSLIDNGATDASAIVTIAQTDAGFESQRCGTWTKIE